MTANDPTYGEAATTEWVVIRPAGDVEDSELADVYEGEWRRRSDLEDTSVIETLSPSGIVRAYPTDRVERSAAGDVGQIYEVPEPSDDEDAPPAEQSKAAIQDHFRARAVRRAKG